MLNKKSMGILEKLIPISDSIVLRYPITAVVQNEHFQAYVDVSKNGSEKFEDFAIYSFGELTSAINIVDEPVVSKEKGFIVIDGGPIEIKYLTSPLDMLEEFVGNYSEVEKIKLQEKISNFELSSENLNKIKKAAKVFGELTNLKITTKDSEINLIVTSNESRKNDYVITVDGSGTADLEAMVILDFIDKIPPANYTVDIYKAEETKVVFTNQDLFTEIILSSK